MMPASMRCVWGGGEGVGGIELRPRDDARKHHVCERESVCVCKCVCMGCVSVCVWVCKCVCMGCVSVCVWGV